MAKFRMGLQQWAHSGRLDDATIAVYNVRQDGVQWASKKTHKAAVTGAGPCDVAW